MTDLPDVEFRGEITPDKLECFEVEKNSRGYNYKFRIVGKDLFSNDAWVEKVKNIRDKANELCSITDVKKKIETVKREELENGS
jgi:hypothetical protein